jgi:PKD repeat protein
MNSLSNEYQIWFSDDFKEGFLTSNRRSRSKEIFEISTTIPEFKSPEPIRKTYYTWKLIDKNLDTIDTKLFKYYWIINDTLEIPGHEVIYRFPEPGLYDCKLMVYDIQLDTTILQDEKTLPIELNEQAVIVCPDTIITGTPVEFDGTSTYLPGFDDYLYVWDFGDGSFGQGKQVIHTYLYPGRYRVTLGVQERKRNRRDIPEMHSNFKDVTVDRPGQ